MPSISVTTSSPGITLTMPSGVPVRIRSPGDKVMKLLKYSMSAGTSNTMSRVLPRCVSTPLTVVRRFRFMGSGTSSRSTSQGPSGVQVSRLFTRRFGRYQFSR
ncbi:hypothetical protein D3C78_1656570 [compost metagenome]